MSDTHQIYQGFADRYEALVHREDYQGRLLPAVLVISDLQGKDVLELGAGTGRLTRLLAPLAGRLIGTDLSFHMLSYGKSLLAGSTPDRWAFNLASHLALPYADGSADLVISGWSFCYAAIDQGKNWRAGLEKALNEARRVLRPGGVLILIESLGTGFEQPDRPPVLVDYLRYLDEHGFDSTWIRTDYCFKDQAEAEDLTRFFFGEASMPMWDTDAGVIVPECTGLWWQKSPPINF